MIYLNYLLIPLFLWEINKTRRDKQKIVWLRYVEIKNYLVFSAADIEDLLLSYGIQSHPLNIEMEEKKNLQYVGFLIPSTHHFFADVILRQNEQEMCFTVESAVIYNENIPSTRYSDRKYQRLGIENRPKSVAVKLGNFLFWHKLTKKLPKVKSKKRK